ncbi:hypothetical protein VTK73DRAFT_10263 [Phialemonium thermophilum]|uniref:Xylanolytic transcriptional activator regulatory domain-containing protein n=1 Tax=Phialemonium thermophilum TaxID=223376 RepID=A0ABR3VXK6_9PEZI
MIASRGSARTDTYPPPSTQTVGEQDLHSHVVSPLQVLAAAIAEEPARSLEDESPGRFGMRDAWRSEGRGGLDARVTKYFAPKITHQTDWQVLAAQSRESTLRLEPAACDPLTARLIDRHDADHYFDMYFEIRNPFLGLHDRQLYTPEYVYSRSFTLFSVICALGCAVSARPRDQFLYPALLSLAEAGVKWSIAVAVKSVETVQAIIVMQYWAPLCQKQSDDSCWLRLSHAFQLARDIRLDNASAIADQVNMLCPDADAERKERLARNCERTWLHCFISDKHWGIMSGRTSCVSWRQIPSSMDGWWRKPTASPHDRLIAGLAEMRRLLVKMLEQGKQFSHTLESITKWHSEALETFEQFYNSRCSVEDRTVPSAISVPPLAFYTSHSIMVLNAQAMRDLVAIGVLTTCQPFLEIARKTVQVATRLLDHFLFDRVFLDRHRGLQNNQFIMICHAITEILHAVRRGGLTPEEVDSAAFKVRAVPRRLEKIAEELPSSSVAHLYGNLASFFVAQLDGSQNSDSSQGLSGLDEAGASPSAWSGMIDQGLIDSSTWMNMGFLTSDVPIYDPSGLGGIDGASLDTFSL